MKPSMPLLPVLRRMFLCCLCLVPLAALADPAARVGRIAAVEGAVAFRSNDQSEPVPAAVNWPFTTANVITTASGARTELRVGSTAVRLDGQSELHVLALDDARVDLYLVQGSMAVRLRNPEIVREFSLQTAQGQITLQQPGRLRVDAGHEVTGIHAIDGVVRFDAGGNAQGGVVLAAGSTMESRNGIARITDLNALQVRDGFDAWALARDDSDDRLTRVRHVSAETTGYEELERHGTWHDSAEYGVVWTPTVVAPGWAPYQSGRWIWMAPWGWTWVDNAPWGYAPSHYGRWVSIDRRWCWTPGAAVARPVWAPALVGWHGAQNWNLALRSSSPPSGGWFPLAPREVYVPPYPVSRTYVQQINVIQNTNVTQVNRFYGARPVVDSGHRPQQSIVLAQPAALLQAPLHAREAQLSARGREVPARVLTPAAALPHAAPLRPLPLLPAAVPSIAPAAVTMPAEAGGRHPADGQVDAHRTNQVDLHGVRHAARQVENRGEPHREPHGEAHRR